MNYEKLFKNITEGNKYAIGYIPIIVLVGFVIQLGLAMENGCSIDFSHPNMFWTGIGLASLAFMGQFGKIKPSSWK